MMRILPGLSGLAGRVPRAAVLLTICLALMMLSACGKKGPVRPKLASVPAAPADLTLQQQGKLFVLGWTIPQQNLDGSPAEDLVGFRIKRLGYDPGEGCPTCRDPQIEVAEIDLRSPAPAQRLGERMYWRDLDIRPGSGYRYAVVPLSVGDYESPAALIHLAVLQPPPAPPALQAKSGSTQVTLQWQPPALPAEMELVGYNLYRRQAKRAYPIVPVNAEPLQNNQLVDRGLDNGRAYEYRVSALVRIGDQLVESMASPPTLITPQ